MSCLLKYRLYLLQHDKQFGFLVAILAMASIPINQSTPVLYQEFGNGFFVRTLGMNSKMPCFLTIFSCNAPYQNILGLALSVSIAAFLLLLLWIPIWLEGHRK